jgi:hypothetical protein
MIAIVKDILIYITIAAAIIVIPAKLGGFGHIFATVPPAKLLLKAPDATSLNGYSAYARRSRSAPRSRCSCIRIRSRRSCRRRRATRFAATWRCCPRIRSCSACSRCSATWRSPPA